MRRKSLLFFGICCLLALLASCQAPTPACPASTGTPDFLSIPPDQLPTPTPGVGPYQAQVGNRLVQVDKIVKGVLCNDTWRGIVYVTCDVQVYPWVEDPSFLKDCELNIDPQAVIYVAYHNNTAYYQGCSCHTGETPQP